MAVTLKVSGGIKRVRAHRRSFLYGRKLCVVLQVGLAESKLAENCETEHRRKTIRQNGEPDG